MSDLTLSVLTDKEQEDIIVDFTLRESIRTFKLEDKHRIPSLDTSAVTTISKEQEDEEIYPIELKDTMSFYRVLRDDILNANSKEEP